MLKKINRFRKLVNSSHGFSLIEISIAILVIGIILSFGMKGYKMIENANLTALVNQINQYKIAVQMFEESEGRIPGMLNGNFSEVNFWNDLINNDLITAELSDNHPLTKMGGVISAHYNDSEIILKIHSLQNTGILTPKQAEIIDKKIDTGYPSKGRMKAYGENCVNGDKYNKSCDEKCCVIEIKI